MIQPRLALTDEEPLELPPTDGDATAEDEDATSSHDDLDPMPVASPGDPYDDATGEDDPIETELDAAPDAGSALGDDEAGFAVHDQEAPEMALSESPLGDEEPLGVQGEDFGLGGEDDDGARDGGEEGFDAPEPELRVEDLPRLDEGDDDELSVEEATEPQPSAAELRWDDRSFAREAFHAIGHVVGLRFRAGLEVALADGSSLRSVDGGRTFAGSDHAEADDEALVARGRAKALLREGVGILRTLGDGPLVPLESTAKATAFTLLEDGTVIAAVSDANDRSLLVSIGADGACAIVADVSAECDDEAPRSSTTVEALAADERTSLIWAGGAFGLMAFRRR